WVCWSMNSETRIAYGSVVRRHGRSRPFSRNHAASRRRRSVGFSKRNSGVFKAARALSPATSMASSPKQQSGPPPKTMHTCPLTSEQAARLREILEERGWKFAERPYTLYFAQHEKLTAAVYEKGPKLVLQGKGTEEFVQFTLEPEILGEAQLGYEEVHNPEMFSAHFGIDESGKGDFFGPLVIAGAYVEREIAHRLLQGGIQDSKRIGSDARIRSLADLIRNTPGMVSDTVMIAPERYNQLYTKFGNLNRLLAWGHARVIENLLELKPDCPRALSDQFANPSLIKK